MSSYHTMDLGEVMIQAQWDDSIDAMRECIKAHLDNGWRILRNYGPFSIMYFPNENGKGQTMTLEAARKDELITISVGGHVAIVPTPENVLPEWNGS